MKIRIAIPTAAGRLHGHFGGAKEFTLVDADPQTGVVLDQRVVPAPPHQPGLFPRRLREQGVQVVLAGGIGRRALNLFAEHGITVRAAQPDTRVEAAIAAFLTGGLHTAPTPCAHHDDHDHHEHDHHAEGQDARPH